MCFESRKIPMRCIVVLSALAALCGLMMIIFSFLFIDNSLLENMDKNDLLNIKSQKNFIFFALVIFSLATIAISALGFCFICCKNRVFACIYGTILLPSWIIILVIGFVAVAASIIAADEIDTICYKVREVAETSVSNDNISIYLDTYEQIAIGENMCSSNCPCAPSAKSGEWDNLTKSIRLDGDLNFSGKYKTYKECILDEDNEDAGIRFQRFAENFRTQDDFNEISEWIDFFEEEFNCAGICAASPFYWGRSIDVGRPKEYCGAKIKEDITSAFTGLSIATFVSGILLLIAFCMQYCLWRKFDGSSSIAYLS